eukprot:768800-Hanusia_phi.AAC.6
MAVRCNESAGPDGQIPSKRPATVYQEWMKNFFGFVESPIGQVWWTQRSAETSCQCFSPTRWGGQCWRSWSSGEQVRGWVGAMCS